MATYLLLKHYRGAPAAVNDVPMDQWTPEPAPGPVPAVDDAHAPDRQPGRSAQPCGGCGRGRRTARRPDGARGAGPRTAPPRRGGGTSTNATATWSRRHGCTPEAARKAPNLAERDHLTRQDAWLSSQRCG